MAHALLLLTLLAAPERDEALESRLAQELSRVDPELVPAFEAATHALDEQRYDEAAKGFSEVTQRAPDFAAGHRRLCSTLGAQGKGGEGLPHCETALRLAPDGLSEIALAHALLRTGQPAQARRAVQLAQQAQGKLQRGSNDWELAKFIECDALHRQKDTADGDRCGAEFIAVSDSPAANYFGIQLAAQSGDFALARRRLDKAKEVLPPEEHARILGLLDDNEPATSRYGAPLGWAGAAWLALFLAMALVGVLLSVLTLSTAKRLATQKEAHPSGAARALRAVYRGVLALGSVFYYLSLPLVALVVIGFFGGLVYLAFAVGRIPIKLVIIAVLVGGASLLALIKSVFVRTTDEDPGLSLPRSRAPRLFALIDEVARAVGTRTVDQVFLTPGTDLAVFERGAYMKKLRGQGERCLVLGRGVLDGFFRLGFQSVLAHELGHFSNQDTAGGGMALVGRQSLVRMGMALARSGAATWYNPAWWFFRAYFAVYLRMTQGASRLQEVLADRVAIFSYGSLAFASGYRHAITQSVRFDHHVKRTLNEVIEGELPLANLYRFAPAAAASHGELEQAVAEAIDRPADPYDSHPSSRDRLAWAEALAVKRPQREGDDQPVLELFDDLESLEREMTDQVRTNLAVNHNVVVRAPAPAS